MSRRCACPTSNKYCRSPRTALCMFCTRASPKPSTPTCIFSMERYIEETASPLVEGLYDEIGWATEDEPTEELRESFKFTKYLMLTRVFQDDDQEASKKRKREDEQPLVYTRPEDEFFHKLCKWSFQWKARDSEDKNDIEVLKPLRLCMLVAASSIPQARSELKSMFESGSI
mmetsp:Transcript_26380/g.66121  ORF Transcript_26380/g.66121 Transcript_26380/m.66121 type:complete len:172 (+) Transcript_26380:594-1109(+)